MENELQPYVRRATRLISVDREVKLGDTAVIDFEGFEDGKPFEGGKGENYSLEIGSGSFVPGFEDQIIGLKAGDEKDLDITFPEDYVADLAGKAVVFKVKVKEVKESQLPTVDDEFSVSIQQNTMKAMINQTSFAVSTNEARPIHTGALFEISDTGLTMVAVDGFRLALRREPLERIDGGAFRFVAPGAALNEVEKI